MNKTSISPLYILLITVLLGMSAYLSFTILQHSREKQQIAADLAETSSVRYGLLSVYEWKRKISTIVSAKLKDFEITPDNEKTVEAYVQKAMYRLIDEVDVFLKEEQEKGNFFQKGIKSLAYSYAFSPVDFKRQVPEWSKEVMQEIDNPETRQDLKGYIEERIDEMLNETVGKEDLSYVNNIKEKYYCHDPAECGRIIGHKIEQLDKVIWNKAYVVLFCILLVFFCHYYYYNYLEEKAFRNKLYYILIFACLLLLVIGITTPMINIDARINEMAMEMMGESIAFENQILFFQSKSIWDVIYLLLDNREVQSLGVGCLIFLFSIVFPILKLMASALAIQRPRLVRENTMLNFMAFKSAKWSMADVMVVAIFMAYIGFKAVMTNQLDQLDGLNSVGTISTHEHTSLQVGFLFFTAYCVGGLVLSTMMDENEVKH